VVLGAGAHVYLKTAELTALSGIAFWEALPIYLSTASGLSTIVRGVAGLLFGIVAALSVRVIVRSARFTLQEAVLLLCLFSFAYFRAKVSHATANPFFPELSVLVNAFHLVGKDLWAGLLAALSALYCCRPLRPLFAEALARSLRPAIVCFGLAGITAAYIVWLHLKDFDNLTSTLWGERSSPLLLSGAIAALLLIAHVVLYRFRPGALTRALPFFIAAECAAGLQIGRAHV